MGYSLCTQLSARCAKREAASISKPLCEDGRPCSTPIRAKSARLGGPCWPDKRVATTNKRKESRSLGFSMCEASLAASRHCLIAMNLKMSVQYLSNLHSLRASKIQALANSVLEMYLSCI